MCGRYLLDVAGASLASSLGAEDRTGGFEPTWNAAPGQLLPVLGHNATEGRESLVLMEWGLVPGWSTRPGSRSMHPLINARAETVSAKPSFREAFAHRRCLVPVSGFYEWARRDDGTKVPHLIRSIGGTVETLAGIWQPAPRGDEDRGNGFAIITCPANELVAPLHDRMPVIIAEADRQAWLHADPREIEALRALLLPAPAAGMEEWAVSTRVNSVANDGPELSERTC